MATAIEATNLTKTFMTKGTPVRAVRDLTFRVAEGEVVGLLGPNGAGKSTTMRMLATLEQPTAGTAAIAGHALGGDPQGVRRSIGFVAQSGGTRPIATVRDELLMQARLHRLPAPQERVRAMLDTFALAELAGRPTMTLSGGQKRRLDLAIGLIHAPVVLFLDEPTAALDPPGRHDLWEHIRTLRRRGGATVVLSTHHLDEADALCDRILLLDHGRLIAEDSPRRLKQQLGQDVITLDLGPDPQPGQAQKIVAGLPGVRGAYRDGSGLRLGCANADGLVTRIVLALNEYGIELHGVRVEHPSLDDVFLHLTADRTDPER